MNVQRIFPGRHKTNLVMTALLLASLLAPLARPSTATATPVLGFSGGSNASGDINSSIAITDLQVVGVVDPTVSVHLKVPSGSLSMTTTDGLTFSGSETGSSLYFSGSSADVNTALASLHYTTTLLGAVTLEASMVGADEEYNADNGHVYAWIRPEGSVDWASSKTAADARDFNGVPGYLATITSAEENAFVVDKLGVGDAWIGSSDAETDGVWKWIDGPESGTQFYSGEGASGGHAVDDQYINWNGIEPNGGTDENCGQYTVSNPGHWNDLYCDATLDGYLVEYGSDGDLPVVPTKSLTLTASLPTGDTVNISTCSQLQSIDDDTANRYNHYRLIQDIDCSGIENFTPIGMDPEGWDGDPFSGVFDGQGHTISHLTISRSDSEVGLFEYTQNATLQNVSIQDSTITVESGGWTGLVGSLVGDAEGTLVRNVSSNATIAADGSWAVGGIVGYVDDYNYDNAVDGSITDAVFTGSVAGQYSSGGIVGAIESYDGINSVVTKSYSDATIESLAGAGGIVGSIYISSADAGSAATTITVQDTYSNSSVTAFDEAAGGIIGSAGVYNDGTDNEVTMDVSKSYSAGYVHADNSMAAGIVGSIYDENDNEHEVYSITDTFTTGMIDIDADYEPYAIVGGADWGQDSTAVYTNNWYDASRTGVSNDTYFNENAHVVNVDDAEPDYFYDKTHEPLASWDFVNVWVEHAAELPTFTATPAETEYVETTSAEDGSKITVAQTGCAAVGSVTTEKEAALDVSDAAYNYPAGLVGFQLTGCDTGGTATVTVTYTGSYVPSAVTARKYRATTHAFATIPGASSSVTTLDGNPALSITYTITDGSALDDDGSANGTIVDPTALGTAVIGAPNTGL